MREVSAIDKDRAAFYEIGLAIGLTPVTEVIRWADALIASAESPPFDLIRVSMGSSSDVDRILSALKDLSAGYDPRRVSMMVFRRMHDRLRGDPTTLGDVVQGLSGMVHHGVVPDERVASEMEGFREWYYLAVHESMGTVEGVREDVLKFLERNALAP